MNKIKSTLLGSMGTCEDVADSARVSFAKKASGYSKEQNDKLINFLAREGHYAPFGHNYAKFHVKAPIFVVRQLVKHKFLRMSEVSRRYVSDEPEFYNPNWRWKATDKKQGSGNEMGVFGQSRAHAYAMYVNEQSVEYYHELLDEGVCEEQARMVLPVSLFTEFIWSGSMDAFANMCNLRLKSDTQLETQYVAQQIDEQLADVFPVSWRALVKC